MNVPILMYHHIAISRYSSQYYVSPQQFNEQLTLLADWGYTAITTSMLVQAINSGGELPQRPIIITFDDGNVDNYTKAFPIMKEHGFTGVLYIVGNYIDADYYMTSWQIQEMLASGWELGSHTMNHLALVKAQPEQRMYEIRTSRTFLEDKFNIVVTTFSYPEGEYDCGVMNAVYEAGYESGMGLGDSSSQCLFGLYAMHRLSVRGGYNIEEFAALLPWRENFIPLH